MPEFQSKASRIEDKIHVKLSCFNTELDLHLFKELAGYINYVPKNKVWPTIFSGSV